MTSHRAAVDDLDSPHPLGQMLPGLFQGDEFAQRFTGALDAVLAPVLVTLDCIEAYVDPHLAPADFVEWLAGWVGVLLDETWPLRRQRQLVADIVALYGWRGTRRGIAELVRLYTEVEPEILDSGGVTWSAVPGTDPPGRPDATVTVRVTVAPEQSMDARRLEALVAAATPAHVRQIVEVALT